MDEQVIQKRKRAKRVKPSDDRPRVQTHLGEMLRCYMAMTQTSQRALAPKIGISHPTLHRVCAGLALDADTLMKILNWAMKPRV